MERAEFLAITERMAREEMPGACHPLRGKVQEGRATLVDLAVFAVQTYHRNLYSSRFASANHARCPYPEIRRELMHVVYDEESKLPGEPPSHADLMLTFAQEALGLAREELVNARPLPTTLTFIDTIMQLSEGHWLEGIALRASEVMAPTNTRIWFQALKSHYGFPDSALAWWSTHAVADVGHGNIALNVYENFVHDESEQQIALDGLRRSIAAWWVFYEGIEQAGAHALAGGDVGFTVPARLLAAAQARPS